MDVFSKKKRSLIMRAVKSSNTAPEKTLEKVLRASHIRYRKHFRLLPGTPDFFLPEYDVAIFVHGCFWHGHQNCKRATLPKTRPSFWRAKIEQNRRRDRAVSRRLRRAGLSVFTVWTCRPARMDDLVEKLKAVPIANKTRRE